MKGGREDQGGRAEMALSQMRGFCVLEPMSGVARVKAAGIVCCANNSLGARGAGATLTLAATAVR